MADRGAAGGYRSGPAAERSAAGVVSEEHAVPVNLEIHWNAGAPMPHLFSSGSRAFVLFYSDVPRGGQDKSFREAGGDGIGVPALAVAEFIGMHSIKFGGPNDETLSGHPLYGKGLEFYAAHEVINSQWIAEEERINSVHPQHRGGWHETLRHYVFTFHDETLECLAEDVRTEQLDCNLPEAAVLLATRLIRDGR
jgi:hypothetical protein